MTIAKFIDWPSVGASDFNLVWGEVPGLKWPCDRLTEGEISGEMNNWDIYKASSELKQAWDQRMIRSGMRIAGKGHIIRAAFASSIRRT
jgi:hypothetical protein